MDAGAPITVVDSRARERIVEMLSRMNSAEVGQVLQICAALSTEIQASVNDDSNLATGPFVHEFEARLKVHHATHSKPLDRVSLEDAFKSAAIAAGSTVRSNQGATEPYIDVVINGEGVAIKSTAARDVRDEWAHVSKLCEAAWLQDVRGAKDRETHLKELMTRFLAKCARIYQLRVIPDRTRWIYQLLEIPVDLFQPVFSLDRSEFAPDGPTLRLTDRRGPTLNIKLDRSDSKITVTRIPVTRCVEHARWVLTKSPSDQNRSD